MQPLKKPTQLKKWGKKNKISNKKFSRLTGLSLKKMSKAKKQFLGQMAMSEDNGLNSAVGAARALLHFGRVNDFETVASKIQAITAQQLQDVANAYLVPDKAFELIYKKQ